MDIQKKTIAKIKQMPESLIVEVNDYIDFLLWKYQYKNHELSEPSEDILKMVESDFGDYLSNLETYENSLANGEIKW